MSDLREQGFRFMVSPDRKDSNWFQRPDERCAGWTDCTDMDDDQFLTFMTQTQGQ